MTGPDGPSRRKLVWLTPAAYVRVCPTCNAQIGQPCTAPTDTGRRPVTWVHFAREQDS